MARGRKPQPSVLKFRRGNLGQHTLSENPRPGLEVGYCPRWMTPEARAEWRRLKPELEHLQLLTGVDRAAFVAYCEAWAAFRLLTEQLVKLRGVVDQVLSEGDVDARTAGQLKRISSVPRLVRARSTCVSEILRIAGEFGLTPSARARLASGDFEPPGDAGDAEADNAHFG